MGIGDWGLGIGQSPIPNPQSPFIYINFILNKLILIITNKLINNTLIKLNNKL